MPVTTLTLNGILNYNFGGQTGVVIPPPATIYIGLSTTLVTAAGYSSVTEPVGGAYARVSFTNNKTNWAAAATGIVGNAQAITFTKSTAAWGTILSLFIIDTASSTGNVLWYKTLSPSLVVQNGTVVTWAAGEVYTQYTDLTGTTGMINAVLDYCFGGQTGTAYIPVPATIYFGLSTTLVTAAGYSSVTEPSGNAYARVSYTNDTSATGWTTATAGTLSNKAAIAFPKCTPATWGTALSVFIIDTASGAGNVLHYYTLSPSLVVPANMTPTFVVGSATATLV